ncbi:MAG TPA: hypothetical protein VJS66_07350, partial [Burkholderiales bacterium]|nr:hypothetical protein [Burkholderiales bacterium]
HSFLDFNLYILSILLLAGMVVGRFHTLVFSAPPIESFSFRPVQFVNRRGYRILTVLVGGSLFLYILAFGLASFEYRRGSALTMEAKWDVAYSAFERAQMYYPYADNIYTSRADLLRHMISVLPESASNEKKAMFEEADRVLARAEELNPLRPQTFSARAVLYEKNPTLAGPEWVDTVIRNHRRAVELEPRAYQARFLYADFLVKRGRREEAKRALEEGMKYVYVDNTHIAPYYALTAKLRADAGDREGATLLQRKIDVIKKTVPSQKGKLQL